MFVIGYLNLCVVNVSFLILFGAGVVVVADVLVS